MILQNQTILQNAALIVFLKRNRRWFWSKLGNWSCSHDPQALQGADRAFRIARNAFIKP
jgi:hypothetical protein